MGFLCYLWCLCVACGLVFSGFIHPGYPLIKKIKFGPKPA